MFKRTPNGRFTSKGMLGSNNPKWKGEKVGYSAVHSWIYRTLGKASKCEDCKSVINIQWANISKRYKRNIKDWKQLCASCHDAFDGIAKLSKEDAKKIRIEYLLGHAQNKIAKKYGVSQMSISNIVTFKTKYYA